MSQIVFDVPSWNQIYDLLLCLTQRVRRDDWLPGVVVGVCRGGLVPARIFCDLLETSAFATVQIKYYVGIAKTGFEPELVCGVGQSVLGKKVLLVDDIVDSGKSLRLAKQYLVSQGAVEVKTATLYMKPESVVTPDYFGKQTACWVVFPWDTKETIREIIKTQNGTRAVNRQIGKLIKAGLPKHLAEKLLADMNGA
jgi:uncharacterized protein